MVILISGCKNKNREDLILRNNSDPGDNPGLNNTSNPGSLLFESYGCGACHSMEGEELYGPPLDEIWQKRIDVIRNGRLREIKADRNFLTRSVVDPGYEKPVGFESKTMPDTYLTEKETELIVDYIISVNKQKNN